MLTPLENQPNLASNLGLPGLLFKREDLHPYKSHKGRSIPVMIDHYCKNGDQAFALSSSGNAALAAAIHVNKLNQGASTSPITLDIFVGNHVSPSKLERIKKYTDDNIRILIKERPIQALSQAMNEGRRSLRQSTDNEALVGYESLAQELIDGDEKIGAVFMGTSSGTTAQALASYFLKHKAPIQVHIVQTSSCHPLSDSFDTYEGPDEKSIADAIVDITAQRKSALIPAVEKTGGRGWFATNDDIRTAQELAQKHSGLDVSTNSALSIVGAMKAAYTGYEINGTVVCMICGE